MIFRPLCVKEPGFLEAPRMKEINTQHNTQDPTQTPQPKAISPSLLWPWNDHILLLFPHLHWEDKTHTELIVSPQTGDSHWFSLFFSKKQERFVQLTDTSSFSPKVGTPKSILGKQECSGLLDHLHHAWAGTENGVVDQLISPAIFRGWFLYRDRSFSPGFWCWSLTTPDGRVQCHGSYLQREQGHWEELIAGPVILSGVRCEESAILFLILTHPSWEPGRLQLINCLQIALLTWQMKHLHWWGCLDN